MYANGCPPEWLFILGPSCPIPESSSGGMGPAELPSRVALTTSNILGGPPFGSFPLRLFLYVLFGQQGFLQASGWLTMTINSSSVSLVSCLPGLCHRFASLRGRPWFSHYRPISENGTFCCSAKAAFCQGDSGGSSVSCISTPWSPTGYSVWGVLRSSAGCLGTLYFCPVSCSHCIWVF